MQVEACIELAKIYEHKLRTIYESHPIYRKGSRYSIKQKKEKQEDLIKRLTRLHRKQGSL